MVGELVKPLSPNMDRSFWARHGPFWPKYNTRYYLVYGAFSQGVKSRPVFLAASRPSFRCNIFSAHGRAVKGLKPVKASRRLMY